MLHKDGDRMTFARVDDYYIGVCDSDEQAAEMLLECTGMEDDYKVGYMLETMGLGYTDYGAAWRPLVGDQVEDNVVYIAYNGDLGDGEATNVCGSYEAARDLLLNLSGVGEEELDELIEGETASIFSAILGQESDEFCIDEYDVADKF